MNKKYASLEEFYRAQEQLWQDDALFAEYRKVNERFEDRLFHAATVRDEVRRGVRISDEQIEVTMYQWVQRFLHHSPRYTFIDDVDIGPLHGRLIIDLFEKRSEFEPYISERKFKELYCEKYPVEPRISSWSYGSAHPDKLALLTRNGSKTATSSPYPLYQIEQTPLPRAGDHHIILYQNGQVSCAVETLRVAVVPFKDVTRQHAYREAEGDRSLRYWQIGHHVFFNRELRRADLSFDENTLVVCEHFRLVETPLDLLHRAEN